MFQKGNTTMNILQAVAFLTVIKGETQGRDYGPGLDQVIALLLSLQPVLSASKSI